MDWIKLISIIAKFHLEATTIIFFAIHLRFFKAPEILKLSAVYMLSLSLINETVVLIANKSLLQLITLIITKFKL